MEKSGPVGIQGDASLHMRIIRANGEVIDLGVIKDEKSLKRVNRKIERENRKLRKGVR